MWEMILNIVVGILCAFFAGLAYYLDLKKKITEQANAEISNAEDTDKKKEEKMAYVVAQLKAIVPKALRFIFTDKAIEKIVQKAFDKIEEYAEKQKNKKK